MAKIYHEDIDNLTHWQKHRAKEEKKRDDFETQRCNDLFVQKCEAARQVEISKRELAKRVAEENMMLASNKKRQEVNDHVTENIKRQQETNSQKHSYQTMIR